MSLISAFIFPVPQPSYDLHSFAGELLWIPKDLDYKTCKPSDCYPAVFLQSPGARYLVIYFHTNGEDLGHSYSFAAGLRMVLEVHVLVVEYPGYGICPGEATEESINAASDAAVRFAEEVLHWPEQDTIFLGRSLGCALALRQAKRRASCHGLLLVAPFLSVGEVAAQFVGRTLANGLAGDMFNNRALMSKIQVPTIIIHGKQDRLVPWTHGWELHKVCPHALKEFVCPDNMGHNADLLTNPNFLVRPMFAFFALPDYNFEEFKLPSEAFDKRLAVQPKRAPNESCPGCWRHEVHEFAVSGPRSQLHGIPGSTGDVDGLDGSLQHFRSPHILRLPPKENLVRVAPLGNLALQVESVGGRFGGLGFLESTKMPSAAPPRPTDQPPSPPATSREDTLVSLPGLKDVDIEVGIARFLLEQRTGETEEPEANLPTPSTEELESGLASMLRAQSSGRSVREAV